MTEERLHSIEKCLTIFSKIDISTVDDLISDIRTLRKLVEAVDGGGFDTEFHDVDGKNWFDVRDKVLK